MNAQRRGSEMRMSDISNEDPASDPRTRESLLAATPDGATNGAVEVATAVAETNATPAALAAMLVALGGSINDEDDLVVLLQRVVDVAHEAIDGAECTSITIALGGRTYTAVHTDTRTLRVDQGQYDADDGPCLHAARTGETVLVDVDATERTSILAGDLIRVTQSTLDAQTNTPIATPIPDTTSSLPAATSEPS